MVLSNQKLFSHFTNNQFGINQCKKFSVLYMSELDAEDIVMKKETMAPFFWKLLLITN